MPCRPARPIRPLVRFTHQSRPFWIHGSSRPFAQSHGVLNRQRKKPSFTPSNEQMKIAKLCATQNVVVSARPGSGKTATAEAIVAAHPDKRIGVLTYSKRLQLETKRRLQGYRNCEVWTFHGMAGKLFKTMVLNDTELREQRWRAQGGKGLPRWDSAPFDIIVLDEFQDCTDTLFWLTNSFILANDKTKGDDPARIVVLGDERQCIHQYRSADPRYLSLAPDLLRHVNPYPFAQIPLSESFRLSNETVQFINRTFLGGEPYITGSKVGPKPMFLRCLPFDSYNLARNLSALIHHHGAQNTAILAPSIRNNGPIQDLTNILSEHYDIPIAVSIHDDTPLDDRVIQKKVCVSTIHQFKGSERDLIILFGINSSYFQYFGRNLPDNTCPNEVFVALTRAAKQLVLIHSDYDKLMPFVSVEALYKTADVINMTTNQRRIASPEAAGREETFGLCLPASTAVRDMIRHVPEECLAGVIDEDLVIQEISPPLPEADHIDVPQIICTNAFRRFYERVDDINGLAIVAAFEHSISGSLKTLNVNKKIIQGSPPIFSQAYPSWLCRQACEYEADISRYRSRSNQMKRHRFDWMNPEHLRMAHARLQQELGDSAANLKFEVQLDKDISIGHKKVELRGRADILACSADPSSKDGKKIDSVWEIKFVSQLSKEHIVQACIYTFLLGSESDEVPRTVLFNVRDGNKLEITPRHGRGGLRRMLERVLKARYTIAGEMEDEKFIEMCAKTMQEVRDVGGPSV